MHFTVKGLKAIQLAEKEEGEVGRIEYAPAELFGHLTVSSLKHLLHNEKNVCFLSVSLLRGVWRDLDVGCVSHPGRECKGERYKI